MQQNTLKGMIVNKKFCLTFVLHVIKLHKNIKKRDK